MHFSFLFFPQVNLLVLCVVLCIIRRHRLGSEADKVRMCNAKSAARATMILLPVLGVTWVTGLLSVNRSTIIFQYVFAGVNSLQVSKSESYGAMTIFMGCTASRIFPIFASQICQV